TGDLQVGRREGRYLTGGDYVGEHRGGVHGGGEEDDDDEDAEAGHECRGRVTGQELEERAGDVLLDGDAVHQAAGVLLDEEGGGAEHAEPDQGEHHRQAEDTRDELTDGAAGGDTGDEDAHEG